MYLSEEWIMVTYLPASATPGDDVSDTDRQQQQRDRAEQQPRNPIGQSFAAAQSPTMLPHPDCVHRPYFRLDIRLKKGSEDLERVELEQRQENNRRRCGFAGVGRSGAGSKDETEEDHHGRGAAGSSSVKIIMAAERPDLLR
jgi:hypothetical protein